MNKSKLFLEYSNDKTKPLAKTLWPVRNVIKYVLVVARPQRVESLSCVCGMDNAIKRSLYNESQKQDPRNHSAPTKKNS